MNKKEFVNSLNKFKRKIVISNDCISGYLYKFKNKNYPHPFIWARIYPNDFIYLIENYESINYNNFIIKNSTIENLTDTFTFIIDNKIKLTYSHHHQNNSCLEKINNGLDLYYCDMKKYIEELYLKRIKRFHNDYEPIFILNKKEWIDDNEFYKLVYLPTKYKKIVCVPYNYNIEYEKIPNQTYIIIIPKENLKVTGNIAKYLLNKCSNILKEI